MVQFLDSEEGYTLFAALIRTAHIGREDKRDSVPMSHLSIHKSKYWVDPDEGGCG